jgi:membrane protein
MKKIIDWVVSIKNFLIKDIWIVSTYTASPVKNFLIKQIKIFIITIRGYMENKVSLQASALTYYSLMSVVPLVAMAFGIAKGFGMETKLEDELAKNFSGQQEVLKYITGFAQSMLERTKGGIVAGVGVAVLLYSVMNVLSNIEKSFNNIWQVNKGRTFFRKFADYLAIMLTAPVFMILSSSATIYIATQINHIIASISILGFFSPVVRVFINLIPYALMWIVFTIIYIVMPNTKVKFGPALMAGIIGGTIFQIVQWIYVKFQISVSSYNAIYGTFAALPLFMVWLQTAWLIVLFGAEYAYASQNFKKYEFEKESSQISQRYKKTLSILVTNFIVKKFASSEEPPDLDEISEKLQLPSRIVRTVINDLTDAGVISQVYQTDDQEIRYQPAIDINQITIKTVIDKLDNYGIESLAIANVEEMKNIEGKMSSFYKIIDNSQYNVLLKDI